MRRVALLALILTSCGDPYHLPVESDVAVSPLPGAHANAACGDCHLEAGPPYSAIPALDDCLPCHEKDRPLDHYPGGCADGGACHVVSDTEFVGHHDFLPLTGTHEYDCAVCHSNPDNPSSTDLNTPAGAAPGGGPSCAGCHEAQRLSLTHYVEPLAELPPGDGLAKWDCNACHDAQKRTGDLIAPGFTVYGTHSNIKYPHGTSGQGTNQAQAQWVTDCAACHANGLPPEQVTCTVTCHGGGDGAGETIRDLGIHDIYEFGINDAGCKNCHVYADIRQTEGSVGG